MDEQHAGFGVYCFYSKISQFFAFLFSMLSPGERIAKMNFLQIEHDLTILEGSGRTCPAVGFDILRQKNLPEAQMPQVNYHRGVLLWKRAIRALEKKQPPPNSFLSPQKGPVLPGESSCELHLYLVSI